MTDLAGGSGIFEAAKILINCARTNSRDEAERTLARRAWLREFCTIHVGTARGAGNTFAAARLVEHFGVDHCIVLTPFDGQAKIVLDALEKRTPVPQWLREISGHPSDAMRKLMTTHAGHVQHIHTIIADVSAVLSRAQKNRIYDIAEFVLKSGDSPFIVFVG